MKKKIENNDFGTGELPCKCAIAGSGGTYHWFPRTIRFLHKIKDKYDFKALNTHYFKFEDLDAAMDMACNHKDIARKVMLTFPGMEE